MGDNEINRDLTVSEHRLVHWMLEHGTPAGQSLLPQLAHAKVTPWRCPCGCASFNLHIDGAPTPSGGIRPISDFLFGSGDSLNGILVYERDGILSGLEVHGMSKSASRTLPTPEELRRYDG
jgi:hypothetical protein